MHTRPIITVPETLLRTKSTPIAKATPEIHKFIQELGQTLIDQRDPQGVGLSAVQVGNPIRAFVTYMPANHSDPHASWRRSNLTIETYLNPILTPLKSDRVLGLQGNGQPTLEGCLSIPHMYGTVYRYPEIRLDYQTLDAAGNLIDKTKRFTDFPARVIQHEYDHLEGILFTDYFLNTSPAASFELSPEKTEIYLEIDGEIEPIPHPEALINW